MISKMKTQHNYELLINKGFKIYKKAKGKIWIRNKKGWSVVCDYSDTKWSEIETDEKSLID